LYWFKSIEVILKALLKFAEVL